MGVGFRRLLDQKAEAGGRPQDPRRDQAVFYDCMLFHETLHFYFYKYTICPRIFMLRFR